MMYCEDCDRRIKRNMHVFRCKRHSCLLCSKCVVLHRKCGVGEIEIAEFVCECCQNDMWHCTCRGNCNSCRRCSLHCRCA